MEGEGGAKKGGREGKRVGGGVRGSGVGGGERGVEGGIWMYCQIVAFFHFLLYPVKPVKCTHFSPVIMAFPDQSPQLLLVPVILSSFFHCVTAQTSAKLLQGEQISDTQFGMTEDSIDAFCVEAC